MISCGYVEIAELWQQAQAAERKRVTKDEAMLNSEVVVDTPRAAVYKRILRPDVMQRYLFSDAVDAVPGACGEDLGAEFHCHHGGALTNMRVVSLEPERELTLISDQPTTMYITMLLDAVGDAQTKITRSFLWDVHSDPDIAEQMRQMLEGMTMAGEAEIKSIFSAG